MPLRTFVAALLVVSGCGSPSPGGAGSTSPAPTQTVVSTPPAKTSEPAQTTASTASSGATADGPVGSWSSPSCPQNRKYARTLDLAANGTFTAQDLVAPCPKGTPCAWSGIVDRTGTWKLAGANVILTSTGEPPPQAAEFPRSLAWSGGALSEEGAKGTCAYARR